MIQRNRSRHASGPTSEPYPRGRPSPAASPALATCAAPFRGSTEAPEEGPAPANDALVIGFVFPLAPPLTRGTEGFFPHLSSLPPSAACSADGTPVSCLPLPEACSLVFCRFSGGSSVAGAGFEGAASKKPAGRGEGAASAWASARFGRMWELMSSQCSMFAAAILQTGSQQRENVEGKARTWSRS